MSHKPLPPSAQSRAILPVLITDLWGLGTGLRVCSQLQVPPGHTFPLHFLEPWGGDSCCQAYHWTWRVPLERTAGSLAIGHLLSMTSETEAVLCPARPVAGMCWSSELHGSQNGGAPLTKSGTRRFPQFPQVPHASSGQWSCHASCFSSPGVIYSASGRTVKDPVVQPTSLSIQRPPRHSRPTDSGKLLTLSTLCHFPSHP